MDQKLKVEEYLWTLESIETILTKIENQDVLIAIYKYMTKNCHKLKKEKEIRKCYKYNRIRHLVKNCRSEQKIKNKSIHKELGKKDDNRPRRKKQFSF